MKLFAGMSRRARHALRLACGLVACVVALPSLAAEMLNVYSIWGEDWARPMFEEFEKASGVTVNFVRLSSGEALARVIAEKNDPRIDVVFGGPVETFAAGVSKGVFEPYRPPSFAKLPARLKHPAGQWVAIADDPLVFMTNDDYLEDNNVEPPASWNDLLHPAYRGMLRMADARTSGTAVAEIFSILEVNGRDETKALDYMKKLHAQVQLYESSGAGALAVGRGLAGVGIFFIVDALDIKASYNVTISFPEEGIGAAPEGIALIKNAKNPEAAKKLIDWATSQAMQSLFAKHQIHFVPANPDVVIEPNLAKALKDARLFTIDADYAAANRKRMVERWVTEVLNE